MCSVCGVSPHTIPTFSPHFRFSLKAYKPYTFLPLAMPYFWPAFSSQILCSSLAALRSEPDGFLFYGCWRVLGSGRNVGACDGVYSVLDRLCPREVLASLRV